jgi:putative ABC transport system substrate-binding protein
MRRRDFIALLGGAAVSRPLAARAQQLAQLPTIGFLGTVTPAAWPVAAFDKRLRELGWINGKTVTIDYRWAGGNNDRIVALADEFVRAKVDVILTGGNGVAAVKQATTTIPVVFAAAVDPVGSGLVDSLTRPGGNVTGLSLQGPDLAGKRLELLREVVPGARRVAIMVNPGYAAAEKELAQVEAAARTLGFETALLEIRRAQDIAPRFDGLNARVDVLYLVTEALVSSNAVAISDLALGAHLPTIFGTRGGADGGGLMSYGPTLSDLFRRAAELVDKILRGAKPGDIPVEQPTKFELVINLKTAKALGLTMPPTLLATADEVIE